MGRPRTVDTEKVIAHFKKMSLEGKQHKEVIQGTIAALGLAEGKFCTIRNLYRQYRKEEKSKSEERTQNDSFDQFYFKLFNE